MYGSLAVPLPVTCTPVCKYIVGFNPLVLLEFVIPLDVTSFIPSLFSNYLPEKEFGEIIMRLQQYYDVHYTEATYYSLYVCYFLSQFS